MFVIGQKVRVRDRRDMAIIMHGVITKIGGDSITVKGKFVPDAFGDSGPMTESEISVPHRCVEPLGD